MKLELQKLSKITDGKILSQMQSEFESIGTDTRKDLSGQIFIALKGEAFDAHDFVEQAVDKGAAAILVHETNEKIEKLKSRVSVLLVQDTLIALQKIGNAARKESKAKIVAITGSNGKTTSKEFSAAVIGEHLNTHFNQGSFNNHWGVPFTLLQIPDTAEVAIVEMGMNHAGEITELVHIAEPDVVVCSMVGRAHIEHFGSIEKIAEAKEEIYLAAQSKAQMIFNLDDSQTLKMYERALSRYPGRRVITFSSQNEEAQVYLKIEEITMSHLKITGTIGGVSGTATAQVFGKQNLVNMMVAACAALAVGLTPKQIWTSIGKCKTNWGRNQLVNLRSGAQMIFDAYNANPDSMRALIENMALIQTSGKKIGVFGQMLEMGSQSSQLHEELGRLVGASHFNKVFFLGAESEGSAFKAGLLKSKYAGESRIVSEYKDEVGQDLASSLGSEDIILVKGSRGMKLERFVPPCSPLNF